MALVGLFWSEHLWLVLVGQSSFLKLSPKIASKMSMKSGRSSPSFEKIYLIEPQFYMVNLGYEGVYIFSHLCSKTKKVEAVLSCPGINVLSKHTENLKRKQLQL